MGCRSKKPAPSVDGAGRRCGVADLVGVLQPRWWLKRLPGRSGIVRDPAAAQGSSGTPGVPGPTSDARGERFASRQECVRPAPTERTRVPARGSPRAAMRRRVLPSPIPGGGSPAQHPCGTARRITIRSGPTHPCVGPSRAPSVATGAPNGAECSERSFDRTENALTALPSPPSRPFAGRLEQRGELFQVLFHR